MTVAIVDSGLPSISKLKPDDTLADGSLFTSDRDGHFLLYRDFTGRERRSQDPYGHGTHIAGIIADAQPIDEDDDDDDRGRSRGIAPDVNLVVARAIGADGSGTYADAIAAIDWIVSIKDRYRVGVLNLSLCGSSSKLVLGRSAESGGDARLEVRARRRGRRRKQWRSRRNSGRSWE